MEKKRVIKIRNPKLKEIRNNLRTIFIKGVMVQWRILHDEIRRLRFDNLGNRKLIDDMTSEEQVRYRDLQKMESQLTDAIERSICQCYTCGKADQDMIYNPDYSAWYCVECYNITQSFYRGVKQERMEKGISRADYYDFDEKYHKSFG